jgi:peptide/nickel transport system ATP-binding protein
MTLLAATDISVRDGAARLVEPLSLYLAPGEPLVILGETGSGKTLLTQALMGTLPEGLVVTGTVTVAGRTLRAADRVAFRGLWGRQIAVLPQEPWLSLDPLMRAGPQVAEAHRLVRGLSARAAQARAGEDLAALGLGAALARYPHELSGGMAQRVAIAAARAGGAPIVIADEPTKGLDAARRDDVARLLLGTLAGGGGLIVITHDLALARRIGGRLMVLREGAVVETGATAEVLAAPQAAYTRDLLAADPESWPRQTAPTAGGETVLEAHDLALSRGGQRLLNGLSLRVTAGGILGITGPSGCGKSSLGDALLGLLPPERGRIVSTPGLPPTAFQKLWQDPVAAFPRKRSLDQTLRDVARLHRAPPGRIEDLLHRLRLAPGLLARHPAAVSGGELQRLALLRALLARPRFLFADEPTSRLDPITQRDIMGLLAGLARTDGLAIALVSHDPVLIDRIADRTFSLPTETKAQGVQETAGLRRAAAS